MCQIQQYRVLFRDGRGKPFLFSGGTFHNIPPGTHSKDSAWKRELFHPEPSLEHFHVKGFIENPYRSSIKNRFVWEKKHFSHRHRYLIKCDPQLGDLKAACCVYQLTQK